MTCARLPLAFLLAALVAGTPACSNDTGSTPTGVSNSLAPYKAQLEAAMRTARVGNQGLALSEFMRLLSDPRFERIDAADRGRFAEMAAWSAMSNGKRDLAQLCIRVALEATPKAGNVWLTRVYIDMSQERLDDATDHLLQAARFADPSTGGLTIELRNADYLQYHLRDQPQRRLALLKALFNAPWKPDDLEPSRIWVQLAAMQVDAGLGKDVAATLARIDTPLELVELRSDKRFDAYIDRKDARYDPLQSLHRHQARVAAVIAKERPIDAMLSEYAAMLLLAGRDEEAVVFTQPMVDLTHKKEGASALGDDWLSQLLAYRAWAQSWLGRSEQALDTLALAVQVAAKTDMHRDRLMDLAGLQTALGQGSAALATLAEAAPLSTADDTWQALARFNAARETGDAETAAAARAVLHAQRDAYPSHYLEVLLAEDRQDDAAAVLIGLLRSPHDRGIALTALQDYKRHPSLPGNAGADNTWRAVKQRADVQAEVARVGRIERYAMHGYYAAR
ncbi:TPA: hypothetical protein QDZ34_000724 [Stenotrophomonas maltophilia]|nr:hypothetical protein [Stenotrophomonas maltophilia]HDS1027961.1 hypothetical protein [Stenotrophomonas maltophilia]HDS1029813.1 hypothetical protein [Stenotrophomonas maltophilia]HDS1033409.1 hypothetical protein [Stenotrophomonas maltophilia]